MPQEHRDDRMRVERAAVQLTLYVAEPHVGDRRSSVAQLMRRAAQLGASGGRSSARTRGSAGGTSTNRRCGTGRTRRR